MFIRIACASALALASATSAFAATTPFTDEAAFLAAIGEPVDNFIDFETGFTDGQNLNGTTLAGGATVNATVGSTSIEAGAGSIGGSNPIGAFALEASDASGESFTLTFGSAITYFSAFYIDAGSPSINGVSFSSTGASGDTATFAGLTFDLADNVTEISFTSIDGDGRWGIDDISFGTASAVPLPAGLPLLLSGGLALGLMRRRKRG
ncbi:VPLPA-CTERM sorting domain-containing protein [Tateyamaria sp.]|uniref:VPLPA-CTERM sorting domain-containing protein n=1 Tax=Tateyamaria sp. TaxID=1929288 RepID=UPI0032A08C62